MQFLAITRRRTEKFSEAQFAAELEPEAEQARTFYTQGVFRAVYSRGDVPGAVILIEAGDYAEAERVMSAMPFARKGLMDVEIVELRPYRGFAPRG
ncbi:MAG TPA: hypothetical protein VME66_15780 [Candidatus Acidoferrales bacterium]|nr:hypothetical protein [Candidatus Acidoferrales bacterium]